MPKVVIAIPAYNEEDIIRSNVEALSDYVSENLSYDVLIVVSNNASVDRTGEIMESLKSERPNVDVVHNDFRSMSKGILRVWREFDGDIYVHVDADLSTDLGYLKTLIESVDQGADITVGSRRLDDSSCKRSWFRALLSESLVRLNRWWFNSDVTDYQCGFKAISRRVRDDIAPKLVCLEHGFFSTELIVVASSKGYRVNEMPIVWEDTRESKTDLFWSSVDAGLNLLRIKLRLLFNRY